MICSVLSTAVGVGAVLRSKKMENIMWMRTMICIQSIRHLRRRRLFLEGCWVSLRQYPRRPEIGRRSCLRNSFPSQAILLRPCGLVANRPTRIKDPRRIRRRRRIRRIRLLEKRRVETHVIHARIRCDHRQIIRASGYVGRPLRTGIPRREVHGIHDANQNESQDEPQNTRDRPVTHEQDVADIQMRTRQKNPVQTFRQIQCLFA